MHFILHLFRFVASARLENPFGETTCLYQSEVFDIPARTNCGLALINFSYDVRINSLYRAAGRKSIAFD